MSSARSLIDTSKLQNQKFTRATTKSGRPAGLLPKLRMSWREGVIEHVIGNAATKGDSLRLVKGPVNAKINSALAVQLVGNKRERDVIGAVKPAHRLEERPSEPSMTGWISGERRSKVRPVEIAGRRA